MTWELFVFLFLAVSGLAAAIMVVGAREIVHSVIALATCFIAVACMFVMLSAEFVAVVQILVYVGAVVVVILFGIMLTRRGIMESEKRTRTGAVRALAVLALALIFIGSTMSVDWPGGEVDDITNEDVGTTLFGNEAVSGYSLIVLFVGILLLVALLGGVFLAKEEGEK